MKTLEERFWPKVEKTAGCWKWLATKHKGYGMIRLGGLQPKIAASRVSWLIHFGVIPEGMHVLHKCDNPECTNPKHLFLGTHADNMKDKTQKGRNGHTQEWKNNLKKAGMARRKLTEQESDLVRVFFNSGASIHGLARMFEVDRNAIKRCLMP